MNYHPLPPRAYISRRLELGAEPGLNPSTLIWDVNQYTKYLPLYSLLCRYSIVCWLRAWILNSDSLASNPQCLEATFFHLSGELIIVSKLLWRLNELIFIRYLEHYLFCVKNYINFYKIKGRLPDSSVYLSPFFWSFRCSEAFLPASYLLNGMIASFYLLWLVIH